MEDFLNQFSDKSIKVPETLYHYTSQAGLLGIIKNDEIWMTHTQYLNDTQEFHHATELIQAEIKRRLEGASDTNEKSILNEMLTSLNSNLSQVNICVSCFSEEGDSLSQWRAYGSHMSGYSIGFSGSFLSQIAANESFRLVKCIYDSSVKNKIVTDFVDLALSNTLKHRNATEENDGDFYWGHGSSITNMVFKLAPILKDSSFVDEQEWRVISRPLSCTSARFDYRQGNSMIIPYYKLPLINGTEHTTTKRFQNICVGPTPNVEQSITSVNSLLVSKGMGSALSPEGPVEVKSSSVPYRSW